jgi:hypothetical protein
MRRRTLIFAGALSGLLALAALPGTAALAGTSATTASVVSVSCPAAGACAAGGYSTDATTTIHAFLLSERSGTWGQAAPVPGLAALAKHNSQVSSVSCGSAGVCAAGGAYAPDAGGSQAAFVVSERGRHWAKAIEVPGLAALDTARQSVTNSVSCSSAGTCAAGGEYTPEPAECPTSAPPGPLTAGEAEVRPDPQVGDRAVAGRARPSVQ